MTVKRSYRLQATDKGKPAIIDSNGQWIAVFVPGVSWHEQHRIIEALNVGEKNNPTRYANEERTTKRRVGDDDLDATRKSD